MKKRRLARFSLRQNSEEKKGQTRNSQENQIAQIGAETGRQGREKSKYRGGGGGVVGGGGGGEWGGGGGGGGGGSRAGGS